MTSFLRFSAQQPTRPLQKCQRSSLSLSPVTVFVQPWHSLQAAAAGKYNTMLSRTMTWCICKQNNLDLVIFFPVILSVCKSSTFYKVNTISVRVQSIFYSGFEIKVKQNLAWGKGEIVILSSTNILRFTELSSFGSSLPPR